MLDARPKVAELSFQLYGRPLHPELFDVFAARTIDRGPFSAHLQITSTGHVITWSWNGQVLVEVATSAQQPLPQHRRLFGCELRGHRSQKLVGPGGVRYWTQFQLERVSTNLFWMVQKELASSTTIHGLVHQFGTSGRMSMGAVSYIHAETRRRWLYVQAFHTFPDDYAIVKSESRFFLPDDA